MFTELIHRKPLIIQIIYPFIRPSIHSAIYSSSHPYIYPVIHTSIQSSIYLSSHPYIYPIIHISIQSSIYLSNHPYIYPIIQPASHSSNLLFIHQFIQPSIHSTMYLSSLRWSKLFFPKNPVFYIMKWKWKSAEGKMCERKVAHNISSYFSIFFFFLAKC